jgi:hypothetical protein
MSKKRRSNTKLVLLALVAVGISFFVLMKMRSKPTTVLQFVRLYGDNSQMAEFREKAAPVKLDKAVPAHMEDTIVVSFFRLETLSNNTWLPFGDVTDLPAGWQEIESDSEGSRFGLLVPSGIMTWRLRMDRLKPPSKWRDKVQNFWANHNLFTHIGDPFGLNKPEIVGYSPALTTTNLFLPATKR